MPHLLPTPLLGDLLSEERLARLQVMKSKTVDEIEELIFLNDYLRERNLRELRAAAQVRQAPPTQGQPFQKT